MKTGRFVSSLIIPSALFIACVPARKYEEADTRYKAAQAESEANQARARDAEAKAAEFEGRYNDLEARAAQLRRDTSEISATLREVRDRCDKINALNNELLDKYNALLSGDRSENRQLLTSLEALRLDMQTKEDSLNTLGRSLSEREAKLAELESELSKKDAAMKDLKDRVSHALTGFEGKGLTIEQKYGRIYVSMENKLLFPSGSTVVDAKGKEALVQLAKAIENEKDLNIMVEGHTDTDKVLAGSAFKDNWDLSVMRATSVVRILQENSKIDPLRMTAAGRGEYLPIDPKEKAKNRRIEVILSPDLRELYKLITE
jgi:chemotaxis protein MotB